MEIKTLVYFIFWCYRHTDQLYGIVETIKILFYVLDRLKPRQTVIIMLELAGIETTSVGDFELVNFY
jgi:hypothetical protein